jgi:hypothetical protein
MLWRPRHLSPINRKSLHLPNSSSQNEVDVFGVDQQIE